MRDTETFQLYVHVSTVGPATNYVYLVDEDLLIFRGNIPPDSKTISPDVIELAVENVLTR